MVLFCYKRNTRNNVTNKRSLGCAQFIEWDPLRASPVQLPDNAVFVIANSLAEANKAATSDFNQRVVECRISCRFY